MILFNIIAQILFYIIAQICSKILPERNRAFSRHKNNPESRVHFERTARKNVPIADRNETFLPIGILSSKIHVDARIIVFLLGCSEVRMYLYLNNRMSMERQRLRA